MTNLITFLDDLPELKLFLLSWEIIITRSTI